MFHHIKGKVVHLEQNIAVIDCGGIGFEVNVTANTLSRLQAGSQALLFIHENIREDIFDLYGFYDRQEKRCFQMLIGVSGVGPKAAMSVLSSATPQSLAMAIISGDEKALTIAPGIGKKIAQRILLELKDKISKETEGFLPSLSGAQSQNGGGSKLSDAAAALAVLGYGSAEISLALKDIAIDEMALEEIIKAALKKMVK